MKSYPRERRLAALLREAVAPMVQECAPNGCLATVRHVRLAADFSAAFVHFTVAAGSAEEVAENSEKRRIKCGDASPRNSTCALRRNSTSSPTPKDKPPTASATFWKRCGPNNNE